MAHYLQLVVLTDKGRRNFEEDPEWIKAVDKEIELMGAKILVQYALLGQFDFVNMVMKLPIASTHTMEAHAGDGSVTGRMAWTGEGEEGMDINPATVIVNEDAGLILQQFGSPILGGIPVLTYTLTEATGIFESIQQASDWHTYVSGYRGIPLIPGMPLVDNLNVPPISTFGQAVTVGEYIPEPSTLALLGIGALALTVGWWRRRR